MGRLEGLPTHRHTSSDTMLHHSSGCPRKSDAPHVAYTYDAGDRLLTAVDSSAGTITLGYDDLDRLTSAATPQGTTTYGYDSADRRTSMTLAGQPQVTYSYDAADRVGSITQGSAVVGFTYDDAGRPLTETLPNGVVGTYAFDDAGHATAINYAVGQTTIGDLSYTYDAAGHRMSVGGSLSRVSLPSALASATYDAASRISAWDTVAPSYDNAGHMTSDGTYSYSWNARGQLTGVSQGQTAVASYTYDAFGRRTSRNISGTTTRFAYDGASVVQEQDGSGTPTANLLVGGLDQVFSRTDAAGSRYFLTDALGSILSLTDGAGAPTTSYTYEPFGKTTVTGASNTNAAEYTGRENDGALYFYRARYLQPTFGRFLSEDPIGFTAGDTNLSSYVGDNPTCRTDPSGRIAQIVAGCVVGGALSVGFDLVMNYFGGRKTTVGEVLESFGGGCLLGAGLSFLGPAAAADEAAAASGEAAATSEASSAINITTENLAHVINRHTIWGLNTVGRSIFGADVDIVGLIRLAEKTFAPFQQTGGNWARIVDAGTIIGIYKGMPTQIYTVITNAADDLVTMFPGIPR